MINTNELVTHTQNLSILFAEDHEELRVRTTEILNNIFKTVDVYDNGKDAFDKYVQYNEDNGKTYDIVLSDIRMPQMDGIKLTEEIYKIDPKQIIIILSAYDETKYLLELINLGIQQFIKKPVDYDELLQSFINSSKKLKKNIEEDTLAQTEVTLDRNVIYSKDTKSISTNGENVYLTKFEIIFVELLIQSLGKIYSNEDIVLHYTSLNEVIDSSNIRKLVSKLRKKLPENSIESIYGIGYKFIPYQP